MAWQLLAMWLIVLTTIVWFVRDERRLRARSLDQQARRYASHPYRATFGARVPVPVPVAAPVKRTSSLLRNDRAYFDRLLSRKR